MLLTCLPAYLPAGSHDDDASGDGSPMDHDLDDDEHDEEHDDDDHEPEPEHDGAHDDAHGGGLREQLSVRRGGEAISHRPPPTPGACTSVGGQRGLSLSVFACVRHIRCVRQSPSEARCHCHRAVPRAARAAHRCMMHAIPAWRNSFLPYLKLPQLLSQVLSPAACIWP